MTRFDSECAKATAKAVLEMVGHLLRPEEQREFYGMVVDAVRAGLLQRDEQLARDRMRLLKPSDN